MAWKDKASRRAWQQRPEVRARARAYSRAYEARPEVRAKKREYNRRADVVAKKAANRLAWGKKPENKRRMAEVAKQASAVNKKINAAILAAFRAPGCAHCGSKEELHAHHLRDKKFVVGGRAAQLIPASFKAELDKCIPLCRPCHIEHHRKERELSKQSAAQGQMEFGPW
jgi:hypothetical protein